MVRAVANLKTLTVTRCEVAEPVCAGPRVNKLSAWTGNLNVNRAEGERVNTLELLGSGAAPHVQRTCRHTQTKDRRATAA